VAHGHEPWAGIRNKTVYVLPLDLAELAARLGSIDTFHRGGKVVLMEDFEHGLSGRWDEDTANDGTVDLDHDYFSSPTTSAKLSVAAATNSRAHIRIYTTVPVETTLGFEWAFMPNTDAPGRIWIYALIYDGENLCGVSIKRNPDTALWEYSRGSDGWVELPGQTSEDLYANTWRRVKMIADYAADEWISVTVDRTAYTLSGAGLSISAAPSAPVLVAGVRYYGNDSEESALYVDDFILTQNE
jgi:hypothetical protein